MLYPAEL